MPNYQRPSTAFFIRTHIQHNGRFVQSVQLCYSQQTRSHQLATLTYRKTNRLRDNYDRSASASRLVAKGSTCVLASTSLTEGLPQIPNLLHLLVSKRCSYRISGLACPAWFLSQDLTPHRTRCSLMKNTFLLYVPSDKDHLSLITLSRFQGVPRLNTNQRLV